MTNETIVADDRPAPATTTTTTSSRGFVATAGAASLGAGAVHAAAIGVHSEHRQAVYAFAAVAAAQLAWGAVALVRHHRVIAAIGAAVNAAAFGGWVMAKSTGIGFIDGLNAVEDLQWADGVAAALAAVAVLLVVRSLIGRAATSASTASPRPWGRVVLNGVGAVVALVSLSGMLSAGSHGHAGGHEGGGDGGTKSAAGADHLAGTGEEAAHGDEAAHSDDETHSDEAPAADDGRSAQVMAPVVYDPTKPIDLSGVDGVTPEEQARAENLIAITLIRLPQFADYRVAEAAGYHSIGDAGTGHEHFINWDTINDGEILNPDKPESLVYEPQKDGSKKLAAAMFMTDTDSTLDDVPELGGKLTQWHIHDNLCFTRDPEAPRVAGITTSTGGCPAGLQKFTPVPMIHVWIKKHPCGPFAALEGIGGGQIKPGEERLCDEAHGGH